MHQTVARARFAVQNVKKLDSRGALLEDEVGKNVHRTVARARFHKKNTKWNFSPIFSAARGLVDLA